MQIANRTASRDYQLLEEYEAGIALTGDEVKSLMLGRGDISVAHVRIRGGEVWLVGAVIPQYSASSRKDYDPTRTRKLLLHKKQIRELEAQIKQKRLTIVPVKVYNKGPKVKIKIALAKGKRKYEKREEKRRKDIQKEVEKALKERTRA